MPTDPVVPLDPGAERPLAGTYLAGDLRGRSTGPYLATGFVTSLDGRVSLGDEWGPPEGVGNDRDWRLLLELAMQADAILVSGTAARHIDGALLQREDVDDLLAWRTERGLPERPAVVVMSRRGQMAPEDLANLGPRVVLATGTAPTPSERAAHDDAGVEVVVAGEDGAVDPHRLKDALAELGLRVTVSLAGPGSFASLVPALDALYLTVVARLVGGEDYSTLVEGPLLAGAPAFRVAAVHADPHGPGGATQLFIELLPA